MQNRTESMTGSYYLKGFDGKESYEKTPGWKTTSFVCSSTNGDFVRPNYHFFQKIMKTHCTGSLVEKGTYGDKEVRGQFQISPFNPRYQTATYTTSRNQALSDILGKTKANLNLSVDVLEFGQTAKMVKSLSRAVNYFRRINPRNWSSNWLEYQYGWKPLLSSVYSAASEIMKPARTGYITLQGRGSVTHNDRLTHAGFYGVPGVEHRSLSERSEYNVRFEIEKPSVLQQINNYTTLDPLLVAWELVPYSFVVDWFYNLGGYLQNMEQALLYMNRFRLGCVTDTQLNENMLLVQGTKSLVTLNVKCYGEQRIKRRSTLSSLPLPRPPRVEAKLGWQRVVSAGSLIAELLKRR